MLLWILLVTLCIVHKATAITSTTAAPSSCTSSYTLPSTSKSVYVSTSGDDNDDGTLDAPWKTISHAASEVTPGTTVYVLTGIYEESVEVTVSGTSNNPIVFTPYEEDHVVLDGSNLHDGSIGFSLSEISHVVISGFEIRNYISNSEEVPVGIAVFDSGSNIWILNNYVHHIQTFGKTEGDFNAHGIAVFGTSETTPVSALVIDSNEVSHCTLGWSESITLDGNVVDWVISNNIVHHNDNIGIVVVGGYETCPDPDQDRPRFGEISGNVVFEISSAKNPAYEALAADGIYVDGGGSLVITNNIIYSCDIGMEVTSEIADWYAENVTVSHNIIYNSYASGIGIGGYDETVGYTDGCTFMNNFLFENDQSLEGFGEFGFAYNPTNNNIESNTIVSRSSGILIGEQGLPLGSGNTINKNMYSSGTSALTWRWEGDEEYNSLKEWRDATGFDTDSPAPTQSFGASLCDWIECDDNGRPVLDCASSASTLFMNVGLIFGLLIVELFSFLSK
eukprot:TRINITY_DN17021_c0_g1_i1.p1 TRINITY_DN17021_c0_g1~~TRINITY_DN17021_c0_g1_i1.p1  ORF type:complete len:506 (-),score=106.49 TRINITY_DN17021_c0_g1_i1:85-1602(-)